MENEEELKTMVFDLPKATVVLKYKTLPTKEYLEGPCIEFMKSVFRFREEQRLKELERQQKELEEKE